jgi:hypothetical protein
MKQFRRRFPLKPKSVRTPPAKFVYQPAAPEYWVTETITMAKCLTDGKIHLKSDSCNMLAGVRKIDRNYGKCSFSDVFQVILKNLRYKHLDAFPQLHEEAGSDTATISLRYKVPAQPAGKVPTRLSPKLKP